MHPIAGHWQANIAKSRRHPNHQFQSAAMDFDVQDNVVVLKYSGINMSGKHETSTMTLAVDGLEYPIAQVPGFVTRSRWVDASTLETMGMKDGVVMGAGTYAVSADRATMTATLRGVDAQQQPFEQVIVFDRQP